MGKVPLMAFSQSDLDSIDAAIASGELSVEVQGRKVVITAQTFFHWPSPA